MQELIELLKSYKWESTSAEALIKLIRPGIKITTSLTHGQKKTIGTSKFGGLPDVPANFIWPKKEGQPMAFVAQINCREAYPFDEENLLPKTGMFYFFVLIDYENLYCASERDSCKVLYHKESNEKLSPLPFPEVLDEWSQIDECRMNFSVMYSMPTSPYNSDTIAALNLSPNDETNLNMVDLFLYERNDSGLERHQLLGEANSVQNDVRFDWTLQALDFRTYDLDEHEKEKIASIEQDFILLLQINPMDSNSNLTNLSGRAEIYFGIKRQDLLSKNFQEMFLTCQGT